MKLYTHERSSAAHRVRIALQLKDCPHELVPVRYRDGALESDAYREINPQGFVPALEHEGRLITQSLAIIEYLDARYPQPRLIPEAPLERAEVQSLAQIIACDIHPLNNLRVRMHLSRELGLDEAGVDAWCRRWIAEGFAALEARIAAGSDGRYCFGGAVSLVDVVLVPQVRNARLVGLDVSQYPTLARIAAHLETLEAFVRAAGEGESDGPGA